MLDRLVSCSGLSSHNSLKLLRAYSQVVGTLNDDVLDHLVAASFVVIDGSVEGSYCDYSSSVRGAVHESAQGGCYYCDLGQSVKQNGACTIVFISKRHIEGLSPKALMAVITHELAHVYNHIDHRQDYWWVEWKSKREREEEERAMKLVEKWGFGKELEKLDAEIQWKWGLYRECVYKGPFKDRQKAMRQHICRDCGKIIARGEYYYHVAPDNCVEGRAHQKEICSSCDEYSEALICMRWVYRQVDTKRRRVNKVMKIEGCTHQAAVKAYREIENERKLKEMGQGIPESKKFKLKRRR